MVNSSTNGSSNHKFGTTDWNEETGPRKRPEHAGGNKDENRLQYMKFVNGPNKLRIVFEPKRYLTHKFKEEGDAGFGDWVKCSAPVHNTCPLCDAVKRIEKTDKDLAKANKPKKRWLVGAIDRKTGLFRILDISSAIYDQIKSLNQDEEWGDPRDYDINIVMNDKNPPASYYKVNPGSKKPLSEADLAIVKSVNEEELLKRCTPPDPEWVLSKVNTLRDKRGLAPLVVSSVTVTAKPAQQVSTEVEAPEVESSTAAADDYDLTFPVQH